MIRVLIERQIVEGLEQPYSQAVTGMLQAIVRAPGYLSGESLRDANRPQHHFILSAWQSRAAWMRWLHSSERRDALNDISPFLEEPERITLLEPLHGRH
ncbi:antibiotic biosynthesis monooxygenase [Alcanivorax sp. JB21]|uniref:antibiotic biosynthesis monooxygenase family protein n=1 Tax=Alcanivorax limicola TaxID=2874102 RepID=UPI001CBAA88F|nr:antibiotic biosynthesis monooxygenase [Alcanivorax limicola]MBZ2187506.1 antibiotic biosynthesis monooxygenase [Alcanivorax limicola]